jgi:hypothetical protein
MKAHSLKILRRIPGAAAVFALMVLASAPIVRAQGTTSPDAGETLRATWKVMPGRVQDLSINAAAFAYAVNDDGTALRWRADGQKWSRMSGSFQRITAAEGNRPWAINADGVVMRFNGLWWEPKGDQAADVAGDAVGNIFVAQRDGRIQKWEPLSGSWRPVPGPRSHRIALDIQGNPLVLTAEGSIHHFIGGTWHNLPGRAQDIAGGGDGSIAIVDGEGRLRTLRSNPLRWVLYEGVSGAIAVALTPNGGPWAALGDGRVLATTLIRNQTPLNDDQGKASSPSASVPQAPLAQAAPIVVPGIQASGIQVPQSTVNQQSAPEAEAPTAAAPSISGGGTGSSPDSRSGGTQNSSVSPSSGGSTSDPAATTTKQELQFFDTGGTASHLAIGRDGSVFALDTSGGITRWSNARNQFESFPGQLVRIAVDSKGNPWGVTGLGRVFRHDGQTWGQIQGATASDIAIGTKDDVVIVANADSVLAKLNTSTNRFDRITGLGVQVAVAKDGAPWTIRNDQVVQRCDRAPCSTVGQRARSIAIGPDGSVFLVNINDQLMRMRPTEKSFSQVLVPGHTSAQVAVGPNGYPWIVTSERKVLSSQFFKRDETGDRALALGSSGATTGSGATGAVVASQSSSAFTFTKNLKFEKYKSSDPDASLGSLSDVHAGHTGAIYITGDGAVFKFNTKNEKFEALDKNFSISSFADVGEDESGTLWALSGVAPAKVYRLKGTQEKSYTVISSTDTGTPRNMSVTADGTVYVAVGNALYKMETGASTFKQVESSDILFVHTGPGGDIWILNQNYQVQQYTGRKFENRPKGTALKASDLAIGADGSVYAIASSDQLLKKWNASNNRFDDVNITQQMHKVTVTIEGRPWLANTSGDITSSGDIWRAKD